MTWSSLIAFLLSSVIDYKLSMDFLSSKICDVAFVYMISRSLASTGTPYESRRVCNPDIYFISFFSSAPSSLMSTLSAPAGNAFSFEIWSLNSSIAS